MPPSKLTAQIKPAKHLHCQTTVAESKHEIERKRISIAHERERERDEIGVARGSGYCDFGRLGCGVSDGDGVDGGGG